MKKTSKKPFSITKALKIGGIALVSAGLVAATIVSAVGYNKQKDMNEHLSNDLASINADLKIALSDAENTKEAKIALETLLAEKNIKLEELELENNAVIADYKTVVAELEDINAVIEFSGYDKDFSIGAFDLGELNDNQFEKLIDYNVDFDGDEISVNEYLSVKGDFNVEDEVSLMFEDGDINYKLTFDTGLDFTEDSLKVSLLGEDVEVIDIKAGEMTLKKASKVYVNKGDIVSGVEILRISEDSILVKNGEDIETVNKGDVVKVGDVSVSVESIFYVEGAVDNLVAVRIGEDLDEVVKTGDYFDEDEMWQFTSIKDGEIVISLAEDVDEVKELLLPNDFAKISFELSNEDYNDVEVIKKNDLLTEIKADFEDYDATTVEFDGTSWIIKDDNDNDVVVSSLELKNSDFVIDFVSDGLVKVAGINVTPLDVDVSGDEDEIFTTSEGIVVDERDSWNEDDDESIVISVPEVALEAKVKVE